MFDIIREVTNDPSFANIMVFINFIIISLFIIMYFHHNVYLIVGAIFKSKQYKETKINHKYAYVICGRNEEKVIGHLIDSIYKQNYPKELMQVFVCADNCTDSTAQISREKGAIVYERFNKSLVGKSYALDEIFNFIKKNYVNEGYEGYFIFDADNLLEPNYTYEMNKAFDAGEKICTSFRKTKNYGVNWITAGCGMLFYREARMTHRAKSALGMGTYVSGTGFLVSKEVIEENGGWIHHTMVEDIEFSIDMLAKGVKVAYVEKAEFYDEQPSTLKGTWNQRMRWCKGTHQCFGKYECSMIKKLFKSGDFTAYDLGTHVLPFPMVIFIWTLMMPIIMLIYTLITKSSFQFFYEHGLSQFLTSLLFSYLYVFIIGLYTVIFSWKKIPAKAYKKILYCFTFPIYMYMYLPISTISAFKKVEWKQIEHNHSISIEEMLREQEV